MSSKTLLTEAWWMKLTLASVLVLLITNVGLFLRMNQLQATVASRFDAGTERPRLTSLDAGTPAPDFALDTVRGRTVSLGDFDGQPLLLMFSSTDCPACQRMYPALKQLGDEHPELHLLMVSRGSIEENQALVDAQGFRFDVAGWQDPVARAYQVPATPFVFALDSEHRVLRAEVAGSIEALEALASEVAAAG
ncbi:MAG: redoxin domain-containing protein [Acidobacteriota bacterium]